jgi:hypothetical protein
MKSGSDRIGSSSAPGGDIYLVGLVADVDGERCAATPAILPLPESCGAEGADPLGACLNNAVMFTVLLMASNLSFGQITAPRLKWPISEALIEAWLSGLDDLTQRNDAQLLRKLAAHGISARADQTVKQVAATHEMDDFHILGLTFLGSAEPSRPPGDFRTQVIRWRHELGIAGPEVPVLICWSFIAGRERKI